MALEKGQRFTLRDGSLTVGTGVITAVQPNLTEAEKLVIVGGKKARERAAKKAAA